MCTRISTKRVKYIQNSCSLKIAELTKEKNNKNSKK